jgi:TfoX/Sxy family transcriptional regulator of competence genes
MAYDNDLAQRVRAALADNPEITEKRMFGGIAFLLRGLMLVGVSATSLMARVGEESYADSLGRPHAREMDFTGKPMRGYVYVEAAGLATEADLRFWIDRCEEFVATLPPKRSR